MRTPKKAWKLRPYLYGGFFIYLALVLGYHRLRFSMKLMDLNANTNSVSFKCPPGKEFLFLLAPPTEYDSTQPPFQGHMTITQAGQTIYSSPISFANTFPNPAARNGNNWLYEYGLRSSYVLLAKKQPKGRSHSHNAWMDQYVKPYRWYDVTVTFTQRPPASSSLWLHYIRGIWPI